MFDNELPSGFQDADFETAEMEGAARRSSALKRKGICDHGWLREGRDGKTSCLNCQAMFANINDLLRAARLIRDGLYDEAKELEI